MKEKIDLRIIKTRVKLRCALAELMRTTPFDDITVFDLCARAKVRRATFYKHFKDKYDFLSYVISLIQNEITEKISKIGALKSPVEYYTQYVKQIINYFNLNQDIIRHILKSEAFHTTLDIILQRTLSSLKYDLKKNQTDGLSLPSEPDVTAEFLNGGISHILVNWLEEKRFSDEELIEKIRILIRKVLE